MATVGEELDSVDIVGSSLDAINISMSASGDDSKGTLQDTREEIAVNHADDPDCTAHCCICQENFVNPVALPCKHIFCYLCIKGVAARNNKCALCRRTIPKGFLDSPCVVDGKTCLEQSSDTPMWFYQGKNGGWWLYEQRTSSEIEKAYREKKVKFRFQISGFFYVIDFENLVQFREDIPQRRRAVRRDSTLAETDVVKGIAGVYAKGQP